MTHLIIRITAAAVGLLAQVAIAPAAEIKLYSTVAFHNVLDELAPQFQKATENKLTITYGLRNWLSVSRLVKLLMSRS